MSKYFKSRPHTKPRNNCIVLYDFIGGKLNFMEFLNWCGREEEYCKMKEQKDKDK